MTWLLLASLLAGCASTSVPPMGYQGKPFRPEADERAMWSQAEKEEEKLVKTGKIYEDPLLEEYLSGVAARLVPAEIQTAGAPAIRVAVFRDPALNAFAMPNGKVYLHTGLLARVENEAQLAAILGHELTHVTSRHALRFNRDARNKQIGFTVLGAAAAIGAAVWAGKESQQGHHVTAEVLRATSNIFLGLGLQLAFLAAVNGYGRDLEREADLEGMERMIRAGYDPREAPRVFELLRQDHGDSGRLETFFFGDHPRLEERIATTRELLRTRYAALDASRLTRDTEEFPLRTRVVVRENALLDIRAGRFGLARAQLDRVLAMAPRDPVTHLYYGDLHRLQAQRAKRPEDKPPLVSQAREAYERAAALDPTYPDPFRQLGYLYYQIRDSARAREAFEKYLALKPDAADARRVKEYLVELDR
ncbi:MAG: hypothetical protein A3K12_03955 [Candidatus Rokubacteria bacterium RIFCSPLOWO2_12_FULL_71_19]|nr:MAG: hypothetical protein A3K12_03955 [Candidatus Rokubacteria bacterium RIFCSPLOWO2_12_FULL_71_19]